MARKAKKSFISYLSIYSRLTVAAYIVISSLGPLSFTYAQLPKEYTSKSDKAVKHFQKALSFYEYKNDEAALKELEQSLKADSDFVEAHSLAGNIYTDRRKHEQAIYHYRRAVEINPDFFPINLFFLAKLEMEMEMYTDAKTHLTEFSNYPVVNRGPKKVLQQHLDEAEKHIAECNFAINAIAHPVPYNPVSIGDSINTSDGEYFPTLTADEQMIYFTKLKVRKKEEDIYVAHKINGRWMPAKPVGPPINTEDNEGALCISTDGKYLFFTACERKDGIGDCDIYMSERIGGQWTEPAPIPAPVNSRYWESQPSFSSDGRTLYFVSTRPGGIGAADIWKTIRQDDGSWSVPVNLGNKINTDKNDFAPFIHPDDKTLYYTTGGKIGMGGLDIFIAKMQKDGTWGEPTNIGYPINSAGDERSFTVSASGSMAYISSDRLKGKGDQDIYYFDLYKEAQPAPVSYLKGVVFDKNSKQKLDAKFELLDITTGKIIVESYADKVSGEFLVCVPGGREYVLNVSRKGYLFYSDNIVVKDISTVHEPFLANVPLTPIKIGESMVLKNIFFDIGSYNLKDESSVEMQKMINFLKTNPNIKMEVGGHTDNTGDKQMNVALSEKRAKSVYDNLISAGISASRLTYKGYGDTKPLADNATEEGKAKNRRTEFMVK